MTDIRIFDEPCGSGKSSQLIQELQLVKKKKIKGCILIIVPFLSEITRFHSVIDKSWLVAPLGKDSDPKIKVLKVDQVIEAMELGKNIITTHSLYKHIRRFKHLLFMYDVIIDEVPTTTEQVPVSFGQVEFNELIKDNYITVDSDTRLMSVVDDWRTIVDKYEAGDSKDKKLAKFIRQVANTEMYHISGTYCLMPLPDIFFTEPKHLNILTFLFKGTQLDSYMVKRGYHYEYSGFDSIDLLQFKLRMGKNITFYPKTAKYQVKDSKTNKLKIFDTKTGFTVMSGKDAKSRKSVGNFIVKAIKELRANGNPMKQEDILVASHKDAWFGKSAEESNSNSKVSDATCLMKLTHLSDASYTSLITRGTNKHKSNTAMLILGTENLNPNVAKFLGMESKKAQEQHKLSELIQVIYRTAIRDNRPIILVIADVENKVLLEQFLGL